MVLTSEMRVLMSTVATSTSRKKSMKPAQGLGIDKGVSVSCRSILLGTKQSSAQPIPSRSTLQSTQGEAPTRVPPSVSPSKTPLPWKNILAAAELRVSPSALRAGKPKEHRVWVSARWSSHLRHSLVSVWDTL